MRPKEFAKYLARDLYCPHCGRDEDLIPQHRANRGMGGSKARHTPSNIIVLCSIYNGLIESDARYADDARRYGYKLLSHESSTYQPIYDACVDRWFRIDDEFGREWVDWDAEIN